MSLGACLQQSGCRWRVLFTTLPAAVQVRELHLLSHVVAGSCIDFIAGMGVIEATQHAVYYTTLADWQCAIHYLRGLSQP